MKSDELFIHFFCFFNFSVFFRFFSIFFHFVRIDYFNHYFNHDLNHSSSNMEDTASSAVLNGPCRLR